MSCSDAEVKRAVFLPKARVPRTPKDVATGSSSTTTNPSKAEGDLKKSTPLAKILFPGQGMIGKDPMSITLEDLIVQGLNSTSTSVGHANFPKPHVSPNSGDKDSPTDSDYESAHEHQPGQSRKLPRISSEVTITPTKVIPETAKSKKIMLSSSLTVEPIPMPLNMSGKQRPTFNDKIHQTITDFFHTHKDE